MGIKSVHRLTSVLIVSAIFGQIVLLSCRQVDRDGKLPVNPDATKEAKQLLSYLYSISGAYTLTGQHNLLGRMSEVTDSIFRITGKYPAVWGSDFGFADSTHDIDNIKYRPLLVPEIIKQYQRGSIITMTYHQANPVIGEPCQFVGGVVSKLTDKQWTDLLTEGTALHNAWIRQMDLLASHLKKVQEAGIPVLFRPYHEMNGNWFWWGKRPGEEGFVKLWTLLYHHYVDVHKLNNLLWVWSPDKPWHGLKEYYPGDDYVDLIGCDIYPEKDTAVVLRKEWYDELLNLAGDIPIAHTEGSIMMNEKLIREQPRWLWFMGWADLIYVNSTEDIHELYHSDRTLTADEVFYLAK